ncbi:cilia- and flagella-associated protein 36 [Phlebotomus argentipes]|uniref:cilia- and flagella-associated protein 36 n=1 Tax=Phlebotomus argentipes TaxID=94469 RepID=UPI002893248B|nr:cilia- and flagella-associated protein 36 [Phlebotomus argentipes]
MSEDNSWVFDSLVCFLHGPIWNAPLQTFIEEKSLIFDPNEKQDDSNPEYITIHNEYKNLVDFMLGSFMDEMQITPEKFEEACLEGRNHTGTSSGLTFHQGLFQQIWAANDIRIFIRMMTQRNVELQLQALDLIERRQNSQPTESGESDVKEFSEQGGAEETAEEPSETLHTEETDLEAVEAEETAQKRVEERAEDTDSSIDDKFQRLNLFFEKEKMSEENVKNRRDYLIAQRDKILQIKKQTRARQLSETVKKDGRPSSAQVAQKILTGVDPGAMADPPEASLQLRKTLARRLRNEVVDTPRE